MKQAHSGTVSHRSADARRFRHSLVHGGHRRTDKLTDTAFRHGEPSHFWSGGGVVVSFLQAIWLVIALPFRLVFRLIAWLGRLAVLLLAFSLMVVGMALGAGPFFWIGIPLFITGLALTLHCLD
jgi:hypothetical protein